MPRIEQMSALPLLPDTAPFAADQISVLNTVMAGTSAEQRTWLSGFLAGFQAASAPQPAAAGSPARKLPLTILFGTESGNAETLANSVRKAAAKLGFAPRVLDMADASPEQLRALSNIVVIASTWGEGEPPQRAADFHTALMDEAAPRLEGLRYAVLALGDRAYAQFCETGRRFDERLAALGATRVVPRIECDLDYEAPANDWIGRALADIRQQADGGAVDDAVIHVDFARAGAEETAYTRNHPFEAPITELVNLSGSRSSQRTFHVELSLEGSGIAYQPGDAIGFVPTNDPAMVEAVLKAAGQDGDATLHAALAERYDITTLTRPQVGAYAELTGSAQLAALAADEAALAAYLPGRQVIDLLEAAPHRLTVEQLTGLLRPLPGRLYSVASSLKAVPDEAHLLIAETRYDSHGRQRRGVASTDVADRRSSGGTMKIYLKPNPHFRLPGDPSRPIVMIGPGTGVAPFRGFVQERAAIGATGKSWLFFGARNYLHDFLYQLEWQDFLKDGVLTRMDVAFSRDQPEKVYVQHRLWAARRELYAWLQEGAVIYVCGDAQAMAKDVNAMLVRIISDQSGQDADTAQATLDGLRRGGRYLRDVY
jgi:sulfite reductase (NADPH) flavoprotein alpha-component